MLTDFLALILTLICLCIDFDFILLCWEFTNKYCDCTRRDW